MRAVVRLRAVSATLLALAAFAALAGPVPAGAQGVELLAVPTVDVGGMERLVAEQLLAERQRLDLLLESGAATGDELAQAFGRVGQLYLVYDLTEPSRSCLENARRLAPGTFRWSYLLGSLHQHEGRLEEAVEHYRRALELRPEDLPAQLRLAEVYLSQEDPEAARPLFSAALARASGAAAANFGLGRIAWAAGESAEALAHFEEALTLQPSASVLHYHIGLAKRALGDEEGMRESFARRGEVEVRFPDPIAIELQRDATGVGALLLLGRISLNEGLLEEAEGRFRAALEHDPQSAAAHRSLAGLLEQLGRSEEALEHHLESARLEPENAGRQYHVGRLLAEQGRIEEGVEMMRKAARLAPDVASVWADLSFLLARLERNGEALDALARMPEELTPELWDLRLRLFEAEGRGDEARTLLEAELEASPGETAHRFRLARLEERLGNVEVARGHFETLLNAELSAAQRAVAYFHLGNLSAADDPERAIAHYRTSLEHDPVEAQAHFNLATLLGRRQEYGEAARHYRSALSSDPDHQAAAAGEGMALILAGRLSDARARLEEVLAYQGDNEAVAHLLARLLVTASDEQVRDAEVGLSLAFQVFDAYPTPDHAETVGMALAEAGRWPEAVRWQERMVEQLEAAGLDDRLAAARELLARYQQKQPARDPWRAQ